MFKGYIEGYYSRRLPIDAFKDLKTPISHYFYGPKEDIYLRHRWKELDKNLKRRILPNKIKQVYCISPTSEFFEDIEKNLKLLKRKLSHALEKAGFDEIAIFFDDIDITNFGQEAADKDLGKKHAEVLNEVSMHFPKQKNIWFCPSIYNSSLSKGIFDEGYLGGLKENLNNRIVIFWTGDNVISERINNSSLKSIQDFFKNPIAIWDNFYANDYCPSRLFLGPLKGRFLNKSIIGHFLNGTGLKETDKFLLNYLFNPKQKVPYLPKELKPIFSDPFKKLNEKELQRALNINKKSVRFIFENPLDEILLEWKPFLMSSLNDIKLFHLESKKEVEGFLERRYSPLFIKGLTKKR